jgi:DNA-binding PadR family transcriptional regulator
MAVREGLLALLDEEPRYGYQLKTNFEEATGGVWPLNVGQVYTTLDRLERDGFVSAGAAPEGGTDATAAQKIYRITAAGREEVGAWWLAVPSDDPPPRDELMLKTLMAVERGRDHALSVITKHRTALTALLQQRRRERRRDDAADSLAATLVTDALVVRAEADLRWLDICESRLSAAGTRFGHASTTRSNGKDTPR